MNIFKKLFAKPKLSIAAILIVLTVSGYIAITYILSLMNELNDTQTVKNQVAKINSISLLVTDFIQERSLNSLYFDTLSQPVKNKLQEQREKTNQSLDNLFPNKKPLKLITRLKDTRKIIQNT